MTALSIARFLSSFATALDEAGHARIALAWSTPARRTTFYRELMRSIAGKHGLRYHPELFLVDHAFVDATTGVPVVFVESENNAVTSVQEVAKLAALRAPLRLLLSVSPWDPGAWPPGQGLREQMLDRWRTIARQHATAYGSESGVLAAIVGEWQSTELLRFYVHQLDTLSERWDSSIDAVFWQQRMTVSQADAARAE